VPDIFNFLISDTIFSALLSTAVYIAAAYLIGKALEFGLSTVRNRLAKRTSTSLDDFLLAVFKRAVAPLIVLAVTYWAFDAMRLPAAEYDKWVRTLFAVLSGLAFVILLFYAALTVARIVDAVILWYLKDVAHKTNTRLDDELAPLVNRVMNIVVFAVAAIVVLDHFGQNISTLVVSLGVGSLAIALAAQETLANMIAGFVLMIDRPFRVGDRIRLPDGKIGNVAEIGIRSTKVIDDDNVMIITPNAEIVKSQIWNMSNPNDGMRFRVPFGVAYGTSIEKVQRIVTELINAQPYVVEPGRTEVRVMELGDSSVNFVAMARITDPNQIPPRSGEILAMIYNALYEHGIEIPFPQRVVHMAPGRKDGAGSGEPGI